MVVGKGCLMVDTRVEGLVVHWASETVAMTGALMDDDWAELTVLAKEIVWVALMELW
jgi:hypothetical protein